MENFNDIDIDEIDIPSISSYFYKNRKYSFIRIKKIFLFYRYLCKHKNFYKTKKKIQHKIIKNLEKTCYTNTNNIAFTKNIIFDWKNEEFTDIYHIICAKTLAHLSTNDTKPEKVNDIIEEIINDYILSKEFPNKTIKDLYPEQYFLYHLKN